jgi:hypothetical protein
LATDYEILIQPKNKRSSDVRMLVVEQQVELIKALLLQLWMDNHSKLAPECLLVGFQRLGDSNPADPRERRAVGCPKG